MVKKTVNPTPVAKSLHTISVLVNIALHFVVNDKITQQRAMDRTMVLLGLWGRPDPHELYAKAREQLKARLKSNEE